MRILRLSTSQFRNLQHEPLELSPHVNLLVGDNGHGKTNVLEGIHFFKFGRSFRTSRDVDMIKFEQPFARVEVLAEFKDGSRETFACAIERDGSKRMKLDGKDVPKLSELVGRYPSVIFGPHDLALTSGEPAQRRKYLDMIGSMTDRAYLSELKAYKRVLAQRNAALKGRHYEEAFGVWTEELLKRGCALAQKRSQLVQILDASLRRHGDAVRMSYPVEMAYESELDDGRPDEVERETHFAARLAALEPEEQRRRTTLAGPHRDDLRILAGGNDLRRFGSQGQRRLVAILMRLAELSHLETTLNEPCVLLLDDVFSELDDEVASRLKSCLDDEHQIFVTSPLPVSWGEGSDTRVFEVANGSVTPVRDQSL